MLLLLTACAIKTGFQPGDSDDTVPIDTGYIHESDTDTEDTDGDLDGDGFTPEEGDCDDSSVYVSPARDEDTSDALDNDCDGRVDEEWAGLDVAYVNYAGSSSILTLNTLGNVEDEVTVSDECAPFWLDHADPMDPSAGWVASDGAHILSISGTGTCSALSNFEETEACTDLVGVFGIATGLDGTLYATTLDKLWRIETDGTPTEVASWGCSLMDVGSHQLAAYSLAVDPVTGDVGLFGYFGGFAVWSPTSGLTMEQTEDWETSTLSTYSGAHRDEGGWFTPGVDTKVGTYGIYQFDGGWTQVETWEDEDWVPSMMAIDGDEGDYYVTTNAGWYYKVWRIIAGSDYAADLYTSSGKEPNRAFQGLVSRYTYGE